MKEIIYIQAGKYSNFIGTHFFNTQQGYFTYGKDAEPSLVDHDISFREGISASGEPTYSPRSLLFDFKDNYGGLPVFNEFYAPAESNRAEVSSTSSGPVERHAQPPYVVPKVPRTWSDFNQVSYHPNSFPGVETSLDGTVPIWSDTKEEELNAYDGNFRHFIEECDQLQGIQVTFDSVPWSEFTCTFLEAYHDDNPHTPALSFVNLSQIDFPKAYSFDPIECRKILNDARTLLNLNERSSLSVLLQSPEAWFPDPNDLCSSSALLSAHLESVTLPLRLKASSPNEGIHSFCGINDGIFPFSSLSGISHLSPSSTPSVEQIKDFSELVEGEKKLKNKVYYAQRSILRGVLSPSSSSVEGWIAEYTSLSYPKLDYTTTTLLPSYTTRPIFSSVNISNSIATVIKSHSSFIETFLSKHADLHVLGDSVEVAELVDLKESLFTIGYNYDDGEDEDDEELELGEDEE